MQLDERMLTGDPRYMISRLPNTSSYRVRLHYLHNLGFSGATYYHTPTTRSLNTAISDRRAKHPEQP